MIILNVEQQVSPKHR